MERKFRVYGYDMLMDGDDVLTPSGLSLNDLVRDDRHYKFMLYTNCKDKNGKEVYENDIVSLMDKEKFEVVFYNDGFVLVNLETRIMLGYLHNFTDYIKVIGNIYEGVVKEGTIRWHTRQSI